MDEVRLITLDPAHFHAALVQKQMYSGVSAESAVYAPLGFDLTDHLTRVARFNLRPDDPTDWRLEIHAGADFLGQIRRERPGNVVVLSGRNSAKIERILHCLDLGMHVLADKPWILDPADVPKVKQALQLAEDKNLIAYDIMTERYEVTSILQRELVNTPDVFGPMETGDPDHPAVTMESVHRLMKSVAGVPSLRPVWFFDIREQGEALADVGTHLVDLVMWTAFPGEAVCHQHDVRMLGARRWPTTLTREQWQRVTGAAEFPGTLSACMRDGKLDYYCNNFVSFAVRGVHVQLNVLWDFEGPPASDTYLATFRGAKSRVEVRQGRSENFRPEVYVIPNRGILRGEVLKALRRTLDSPKPLFAGIGIEERDAEFRLKIPDQLRVGHEAHFGQVTRQFFGYLRNPQTLPAWEKASMAAKYFITTAGVELARTAH